MSMSHYCKAYRALVNVRHLDVCLVHLKMGVQRLEVGLSQQQQQRQSQQSIPAGAEASEQNNEPPTQVGEALSDRRLWNHITCVVWHVFPVVSVFKAERQGGMVQWLVQIESQGCSNGECGGGEPSSDCKSQVNMHQIIRFLIWWYQIYIFVCFLRSYDLPLPSVLLPHPPLPLLARFGPSLPLQGSTLFQGKQVNYEMTLNHQCSFFEKDFNCQSPSACCRVPCGILLLLEEQCLSCVAAVRAVADRLSNSIFWLKEVICGFHFFSTTVQNVTQDILPTLNHANMRVFYKYPCLLHRPAAGVETTSLYRR